jgi:hypothetical protein
MKNYSIKDVLILLAVLLLASCGKPDEPDPGEEGGNGVLGVSLSKSTLSLAAGAAETLTATVNPTAAKNRNVTWTTDNPSVATVDTGGKVTATKKGKATITVKTSDGGYTAVCNVDVTTVAIAVSGIALNETSLAIDLESQITLKASVSPANAANKAVAWKSSNTAIAKVDANGTVTAVAIGKATITCTTEDGAKTVTCNVTVAQADPLNLLRSAHIPDPVFLDYCREQMASWDKNKDGRLYADEAAAVTGIDVANIYNSPISSLRGIEYFTGITYLDCTLNNLTSLDVSKNTRLSELYCNNNNRLSSLVISGYTALTILDCSGCMIEELDLSRCTRLVELTCHHNELTSLNLSACTALSRLDVDSNLLKSLDLSKNRALRGFACDNNELTSLNLSACTALMSLSCSGNNLAALDLSKNGGLIVLSCDMNNLTALDLKACTELQTLQCNNNSLTSITIGTESALQNIQSQNNRLSAAALNTLFASLPASGTIAIAGNPGTATCNRSIAESKNWTVNAN